MTHAVPDPGPSPTGLSGSDPGLSESQPSIPEIQRGPGVIPPFVAPPREGVKRRRWIGVGIGVAIGVLCCGGGGVTYLGLGHATRNQQLSDANTVVTKYMDDKKNAHFASAYQLLCADLKDRYTLPEFTSEVIKAPILNFVVRPADADTVGLTIPVSVTYLNGEQESEHYTVVQTSDGDSRVCGGSAF